MAFTEETAGIYPQTAGPTEAADRHCVQNLHLHVFSWRALSLLAQADPLAPFEFADRYSYLPPDHL